jgi:hypothetical protein
VELFYSMMEHKDFSRESTRHSCWFSLGMDLAKWLAEQQLKRVSIEVLKDGETVIREDLPEYPEMECRIRVEETTAEPVMDGPDLGGFGGWMTCTEADVSAPTFREEARLLLWEHIGLCLTGWIEKYGIKHVVFDVVKDPPEMRPLEDQPGQYAADSWIHLLEARP